MNDFRKRVIRVADFVHCPVCGSDRIDRGWDWDNQEVLAYCVSCTLERRQNICWEETENGVVWKDAEPIGRLQKGVEGGKNINIERIGTYNRCFGSI